MDSLPEIPDDWTATERWVWTRICAGQVADLSERDDEARELDASQADGWEADRRLRVDFLQTILTRKAFVERTPYGGVRILGALVDDAPLHLDHGRLPHALFLMRCRVLVAVQCEHLRVDGPLSFEGSWMGASTNLFGVQVRDGMDLSAGTFRDGIDLGSATIDSNLIMSESLFGARVSLNRITVGGSAFLRGGATFEGEVDLGSAKIGSNLELGGSTFEDKVTLNRATIDGSAFLHDGATFEGHVDLVSVRVGSNLELWGSKFKGGVDLFSASIQESVMLHGDTLFTDDLNLGTAKIGANLDMAGAQFQALVDMTACEVSGELDLGWYESTAARWSDDGELRLRNAHVGALQDWWQDQGANSWPRKYQLEGFTYDRLGASVGAGREADMLHRPTNDYLAWLAGDPVSSPQPFEQLAGLFLAAGQPHKTARVLFEARERTRRRAWSRVDNFGGPKPRQWTRASGLWLLRATIGYGLGAGYFRALWWVVGLTVLGVVMLMGVGTVPLQQWPEAMFASLDQLLPVVTLDTVHEALIFGDPKAAPPVARQPDPVPLYFYLHKLLGWVLGSFLVAGLAGLTQRD